MTLVVTTAPARPLRADNVGTRTYTTGCTGRFQVAGPHLPALPPHLPVPSIADNGLERLLVLLQPLLLHLDKVGARVDGGVRRVAVDARVLLKEVVLQHACLP